MNKLLVDTNILIYAKDKSSQFHQKSKALFNSSFELHTTSKNLAEYYAVTTRGVSPLLTSEDALADLYEFSANFAVLFPNELSLTILKEFLRSGRAIIFHAYCYARTPGHDAECTLHNSHPIFKTIRKGGLFTKPASGQVPIIH